MAPKLNPNSFIHDMDRKALESLKAVPGFTPLVKAFMKIFSSRTLQIMHMSGNIKLSPEQCPRLYNLLVPICDKFGIPVPDMFLELNRSPNAYTQGEDGVYVCVVVTTGLLEIMDDKLVSAILAHEVGHIICHHVLYRTIGSMLLNTTASLLGLGGLVTEALNSAFMYWIRCSEFSADRAATLYCGEPDTIVETMMRLAGGTREVYNELNRDLFLQQADEYAQYVNTSKWNKILEFIVLKEQEHPFLAVRSRAAIDFAQTKEFKNLVSKLNGESVSSDGTHCPHCGTPIKPGQKFCRKCGKKIDEQEK